MTEHQQLDYKRNWQDDWLKTICAFADAQGGRLVVGCDDDGNPVGLKNPKKLLEDIPNKVRDVLGVIVDVNLCADDEALEVCVEPYPNPISYKGEYFYRSGTTTQSLNGTALERFLLRKRGVHWDGVPVPHLSVEDLDATAFSYFRRAASQSGRMDEAVLQDSNDTIIDNLQLREGQYLRRASALLFHENPEHFVPGAYVKIGFFRSESDLAYQDEVHGNLFLQAEKTLDLLLTKYMKAYISYQGAQRIERFLFPRAALREVLHNALVHRDYSTGIPIQIRVYEDQIRFYNNGHLPEGWTVKQLLEKHKSEPSNPLLANAFFRSGDIEAWGRGIDTIRDACRKNETGFPVFESDSTGMMVEFKGQIPADIQEDEGSGETLGKTPGKTLGKTRVKTGVKTGVKILLLLRANKTMTREEMAQKLGISVKGIDWQITKLKQEGKLKRIGPDKGGHWEVLKRI